MDFDNAVALTRGIYRSSIILTALKRLYLDKMTVHPFC